MITIRSVLPVLVVLSTLFSAPARAHDGLHEKIVEVTRRIGAEPGRGDLRLLRSDLYRRHKDWDRAFTDLDRARTLDPNLQGVEFTRGQIFRDLGWLASAAAAMDRHLERQPLDVIALRKRAELASSRSRPGAAVTFYDRLILAGSPATPDAYIARAKAQLATGEGQQATALEGVEQGIKKLGDAVPLMLFAVDLDRGLQEWDRALGRIDRLASYSSRRESYHALRGDVLLQAERHGAAEKAYRSCLESISLLRTRRRQTDAVQKLEARIRLALDAFPSEPNQSPPTILDP